MRRLVGAFLCFSGQPVLYVVAHHNKVSGAGGEPGEFDHASVVEFESSNEGCARANERAIVVQQAVRDMEVGTAKACDSRFG